MGKDRKTHQHGRLFFFYITGCDLERGKKQTLKGIIYTGGSSVIKVM